MQSDPRPSATPAGRGRVRLLRAPLAVTAVLLMVAAAVAVTVGLGGARPSRPAPVVGVGVADVVWTPTPSPEASTTPSTTPSGTPAPTPSETPLGMPEAEAGAGPDPVPVAGVGAVTAADRAAGVRSTTIPQAAGRTLITVPGTAAAPGRGTRYRVRVQVEKGLDVDRAAFADFVMATLNDPRSWGHGGTRTFARIDGTSRSAPDITVVLASPDTSARMCAPLQTRGTLSCAQGRTAVLTLYRWIRGTADYGRDRTGYRHYLVNHEVGHVLGHGHVACPGRGRPAPVMMQQTKGLNGCARNPWPSS